MKIEYTYCASYHQLLEASMVGWFLLLICNETQVYVMFSNNSLQYKQKLVSPYTRAYANFVVAVSLGPPLLLHFSNLDW